MRLDFDYRVLSIVCAIDLMAACFVYMLTANIENILMATHSGSMVTQINALPPSLLGQSRTSSPIAILSTHVQSVCVDAYR
jgi:hypothetical protein